MREALLPTINNLPLGNLEAYISAIHRIPVLDAEQEKTLAYSWYDHHDLQAAQQLIVSHLRLVVKVARGYLGYGLALNDLIQEGNVGLMKAVKRFNPHLGVRLVTFALHWIKAEIHEFILRNWRIVKIATTKAQRKLFFRLRSLKQKLGFNGKSTDNAIIAKTLNVSPTEVSEMTNRLQQDDADIQEMYDIADNFSDPAKILEKETFSDNYTVALQNAIQSLDARSRDILLKRWMNEKEKTPMRELADKYQISIERVRQLEKNALIQLRKALVK